MNQEGYETLALAIVEQSIIAYRNAVSITKGLTFEGLEAGLAESKEEYKKAKAECPKGSDALKVAKRKMRLADNYYRYRLNAWSIKVDCEQFFTSDWFETLTSLDPKVILWNMEVYSDNRSRKNIGKN